MSYWITWMVASPYGSYEVGCSHSFRMTLFLFIITCGTCVMDLQPTFGDQFESISTLHITIAGPGLEAKHAWHDCHGSAISKVPLDYYWCWHLKCLMYRHPVPDFNTLQQHIIDWCDDIRSMPMSSTLRHSLLRWVEASSVANVSHFKCLMNETNVYHPKPALYVNKLYCNIWCCVTSLPYISPQSCI